MKTKNVLMALVFTNLLSAMGITIVVPLVGATEKIFNVSPSYGVWIITAFMLTYSVGMPLIGRISDSIGRRRIYIFSMGLFAIGLLVGALSPDFNVMIVGRLIQGLGASGILPISKAMAFELFKDKKGRAIGGISAAFGIGTVLAINLGGFLYSMFGWRSMFYVPFALAVIGFFMTFGLPESLGSRKKLRIDVTGLLSVTVAITFFMLLVRKLSNNPIFSVQALPYLVITLISLAIFIFSETVSKDPIVEVRIFKNIGFSGIILAALLGGIGMFIMETLLPGYARPLLGYTVSQAAYSINAMAAVMIIFSGLSGMWSDRYGGERILFFGMAILAGSLYLLSAFSHGPFGYYLFTMLAGVGLGTIMTPLNYVGIKEGGTENAGTSSGMVSLFRTLGGIVGPTVAGMMLSQSGNSSAAKGVLAAYSHIFLFGFLALVAATVVSFAILIKNSRIPKGV